MTTVFDLIFEEFNEDLDSVREMVFRAHELKDRGRLKMAAANSATLLLAARFEEYVREMAREYAKQVVSSAESIEKLPKTLVTKAWRRTLETLAKGMPDERSEKERFYADAEARLTAAIGFCKGDLTQDIYQHLVHNETNMRPNQLNELFGLSGLKDMCTLACSKDVLLGHYGDTTPQDSHGKLLADLNAFFERRNKIAHALKPTSGEGETVIYQDVALFRALAGAIKEVVVERLATLPA